MSYIPKPSPLWRELPIDLISRSRIARWAPVPLRLIVGYGFMEHGFAKLASGALTLADIRSGTAATRALLPEAETVLPGVRRPIVLELKILPDAVADLKRLGWLDDAGHSNSAIADAVVELTERALALRLRPF